MSITGSSWYNSHTWTLWLLPKKVHIQAQGPIFARDPSQVQSPNQRYRPTVLQEAQRSVHPFLPLSSVDGPRKRFSHLGSIAAPGDPGGAWRAAAAPGLEFGPCGFMSKGRKPNSCVRRFQSCCFFWFNKKKERNMSRGFMSKADPFFSRIHIQKM